MTPLHLVLLLISVFMLGMSVAVVFLPWLINFIRKKTMTTSERAEYLLEQASKFNGKKVRQSEVFKNRLKAILETIEEACKTGQNRIVITYMRNCHTDVEIRKNLNERNFETFVPDSRDEPNSLRIRWNDRQ